MALSLAEEQELVRLAQNGDERAFEAIILAFTPPLYRVIFRLTGDAAESEAVIQEVFWRLWRSIGHYQSDRPIFPYLVTVAMNLQRDRWRADRRLNQRELGDAAGEIADSIQLPELQVEESELLAYLEKAVQKLPDSYRAVIALRYEAGMSYEEVARALDVPVNTVRTHLRRAKMMLREMMEKDYGR